jgi:lysophospholipase L1-like esterase
MSPEPDKPKASRIGIAARVLAGLLAGAALSEVAFSYRDHGAFPHLNLYTPDPVLGVRLLPGESMKLSFGGNPVTTVRINKDGYRGADFPPPGDDEVLVVGDSQVFGLGVEEQETFSARLQTMLPSAHVINAGVPTYGPPEYDRVLADLLEKRKAKRVVYVVNLANDLFEAERPNTERHAVWDGWAVRKETAPASVASFPGRDTLFRKSHAIFALRKVWYRATGPKEAFSVPSTGTFRDIGMAAARAAEEHVRAREATNRLSKLQTAKVSVANEDLAAARDRFVALVNEQQITTNNVQFGWYTRWNPLKAAFAQPGDIVGTDDTGEYTGPLLATAEIILKGAEVRRKIEQTLRERAQKSAADAAKIDPVLDAIDGALKRAEAVRAEAVPRIRAFSPLAPGLRKVKALCDAAGARLFVAILPIDVQVSAQEWKKYGTESVDLEPARILVEDLIDAAEDAGATAIDLTDPLRAAEPGAFLDRDIHMSPKGHDAVAKALAEALARPPAPKLPEPTPGRPVGRTLPTPLASTRDRKEVRVPGSSAAGCETYIVDEWLTLRCHDRGVDKAVPTGIKVYGAPLGEVLIYRDASALVVQVPVLRNQTATLDFRWPARTRRLSVSWGSDDPTARSAEGNVSIAFSEWEKIPLADVPDIPKPSDAVCEIVKKAGVTTPCGELPLFDNPACLTTYRGDPKAALECLRGERDPACPRGSAPVGVFQRCAPLCSKEVPCKQGTCTGYASAEVCL